MGPAAMAAAAAASAGLRNGKGPSRAERRLAAAAAKKEAAAEGAEDQMIAKHLAQQQRGGGGVATSAADIFDAPRAPPRRAAPLFVAASAPAVSAREPAGSTAQLGGFTMDEQVCREPPSQCEESPHHSVKRAPQFVRACT
eukprot:1037249-Prymnesium_polylepis.1